MKEPEWVREDVALAIHARQIAEHGGAQGIRDAGLLQSALARPRNLLAYADAPDLALLAASYAFGIAKSRKQNESRRPEAERGPRGARRPTEAIQGEESLKEADAATRGRSRPKPGSHSVCGSKDHPFVDGNKRVAWVVCRTFLRLNGCNVGAPPEEMYLVMLGLAEGSLSEQELAAWLRPHLRE